MYLGAHVKGLFLLDFKQKRNVPISFLKISQIKFPENLSRVRRAVPFVGTDELIDEHT
jgi:hypothetical protein